MKHKIKGILFQHLNQVCIDDLTTRVGKMPQPLPDWKRPVPKSDRDKVFWTMLTPFLESPTQEVFDYAKAQRYRSDALYAIRKMTVDLKTTTIKQGSPHTLRITKTNAHHERALKKWTEDTKLLKKLKGLV